MTYLGKGSDAILGPYHNAMHGDVNSVFIEILKTSFNTMCNVICGCEYRPHFMSLKSFNVQLNGMLGTYNMKTNMSI